VSNAARKRTARWVRRQRVRKKVFGTAERPRLSVFRSNKQIYAQLVVDESGKTLLTASSLDLRDRLNNGGNKEAAKAVGELLAKRAREMGITEVVFDRGGYKYHGRVAALAAAAREGGLQF
jgi:large subunit ribosomal protein L18